MPYLNDVKVIARVVSEPIIRKTKAQIPVVSIPIAIIGYGKDTPPVFIDVTFWKDKAEFVYKYIQKGDQVTLEGQLKQQTWEDKNGNKRYKHIIDSATILDYRRAKVNSTEYGEGGNTFTEVFDDTDDGELPF